MPAPGLLMLTLFFGAALLGATGAPAAQLTNGFPWTVSLNGAVRPDLIQNLISLSLTIENGALVAVMRLNNWAQPAGQEQPMLLYLEGPQRLSVGSTMQLGLPNQEPPYRCGIRQLDAVFPGTAPPELVATCRGSLAAGYEVVRELNSPPAAFTASFEAGRPNATGNGRLGPGLAELRAGDTLSLRDLGAAGGHYRLLRVEHVFDRTQGLITNFNGVWIRGL